MNIRRYSYVFLWLALILTVAVIWFFNMMGMNKKERGAGAVFSGPAVSDAEGSGASSEPSALGDLMEVNMGNTGELVGVWVPFMSLTTEQKSEEAFKENFRSIVKSSREKGINALFVHVRPYCDALYKSGYFPWSHILTGEQGKDPGYDPLAFMVEYAHENGMEFHAWINPLRVQSSEAPKELAKDNPYSELKGEYPGYFMEHEGAVYLNPGYPYIRTLIANGAVEIVKNYDVDGIHFDDYFYPAQDEELDSEAYQQYRQSVAVPVPLADWRAANINAMVSEVYEKIKRADPDAAFGISPAGNISNNAKINADVKTWCAVSGYIDYICPQLYYSFDNAALGYSDALSQWMALKKHEGLDMYIGLALYKAGTDADAGTWQLSDDIIKRQIEEARAAECAGVVLYSSAYLEKAETEKEMENAMAVLLPDNPAG